MATTAVYRGEFMAKRKFIFFIIFMLVVIYFFGGIIYTRLYPFDRITGSRSVSVNGVNLEGTEVYYKYENDEIVSVGRGPNKFFAHGKGYGVNKIIIVLNRDKLNNLANDIVLDNDENEIVISVFNTNWWHIIDINAAFDIVYETDGWYADCNIQYSVMEEKRLYSFSKENIKVRKKLKDLLDEGIYIQI